MRNSRRIVTHQVGRNADRARFADPPPMDKSIKLDRLPSGHPDRVDSHVARLACTKLESDIVRRRNRGSHWEKIAQDTGYPLATVKRVHRTAQVKVTQYVLPRRKPNQEKPGYVYFLRSGEHVKIGYAIDVGARIRELQCGNPLNLQLLGVIAADPAEERVLHLRFAAGREQGEWFRETTALAEFIAASTVRKAVTIPRARKSQPAPVPKKAKKKPATISAQQMSVLCARQADPPTPWADIAAEHNLTHGEVRRMHLRAVRLAARQTPTSM